MSSIKSIVLTGSKPGVVSVARYHTSFPSLHVPPAAPPAVAWLVLKFFLIVCHLHTKIQIKENNRYIIFKKKDEYQHKHHHNKSPIARVLSVAYT